MAQKRNKKPNDPALIVGIEVDDLFGHYTYRLGTTAPKKGEPASQLLLLYGDNGTGKTTIAQLLFHLMSRSDGRGHRTFLAQTKFRRFAVRFNNGTLLTAIRKKSEQVWGPYTLAVKVPGEKDIAVDVSISEDGAVKQGNVDDALLQKILQSVSDPAITAYFLSDNRILQSDVFKDERTDEWEHFRGRIVTRSGGDSIERIVVPSRKRDLSVAPSVWRAETWLRQQAIQASNAGEATMSNIYIDIIKRISKATPSSVPEKTGKLEDVMISLESLATRAEVFTSLGLSQPVPLKDLRKIIGSVSPSRRSLLASVLEPYVDSIESRLDAYQELQEKLTVFLDIINSFYTRKSVRITLSEGIQVFDEQENNLDMDLLSSGEKQLLLLLCNILMATTHSSLFIIDEPEISLNIKWQRQLVDSLLKLSRGSHMQFIMATHSIELLTRHKERVFKLDDQTKPNG